MFSKQELDKLKKMQCIKINQLKQDECDLLARAQAEGFATLARANGMFGTLGFKQVLLTKELEQTPPLD